MSRLPHVLGNFSWLFFTFIVLELVLGGIEPSLEIKPAQAASTSPNAAPSKPTDATDCFSGGGHGLKAAGRSLLDQLKKNSGSKARIACHPATGVVGFIGTEAGNPLPRQANLASQADPEETARNFLAAYSPLFGLKDQSGELKVRKNLKESNGHSYIRFQQVYQDIPVLGAEMVVHVDNKQQVVSSGGETLPELQVELAPAVSAQAAQATALDLVAKDYQIARSRLTVSKPEQWIYDPRLLEGAASMPPTLVWRIEVTAINATNHPVNELVLVDAHTGIIRLHFSQVAEAKNRVVCNNNDAPQPYLYDCGSGPVAVARAETNAPTGNADVDLAYDYAGATYDFYYNVLGRDSLDGAGMPIKSTVKICFTGETCPYQNAFWTSELMQIFYGQGFAVADDVVAHELTHGFTEFTSQLFYYYQSGAINESLSDVFGEFVDQTDGVDGCAGNVRWLVGEDMPGQGSSCRGELRNMKDPAAFGDPDRVGSPKYYTGSGDNGGVHWNSGVNNKAAYLMTDGTAGEPGGVFNGQTTTGLGITKVAHIYYEAATHLLTSGSDYQDLYNDLQQACANLTGKYGITPADCQQVKNAVDATEMNLKPAGSYSDAPVCQAGQSVNNLFFDDMEKLDGVANWVSGAYSGPTYWNYASSYNAKYGQLNLSGGDFDSTGDYYFQMKNSLTLPPSVYLHFKQYHDFEYGNSSYDGGVVEYSTDGGVSWKDAGPLFVNNGYNVTLDTRYSNPLGGRRAFGNSSRGYYSSRLNLASLAGQPVRFRFRIGTDSSGGATGWFIDDFRIYTCQANSSTVTLTSPVNPANTGQAVTFTATVSGASGTPTGSVTFQDNGRTIGTASLNGAGVANFSATGLAAGVHPVTAIYSGNALYASSASDALNQTILYQTTTALSSPSNPSFPGTAVTFTARVSSPDGIPAGSVTFQDNGSPLGNSALDGAGLATFTAASLSAGNHTLVATYAGNGSYGASASNSLVQVVLDVNCIKPADSGSEADPEFFNKAVAAANASTTCKVVDLRAAPKVVLVSGKVTVEAGVTILGPDCSKPPVTLDGSGITGDALTLNGATVRGVVFQASKGFQIKALAGSGKSNRFFCTRVTGQAAP